MSSLTINGKYYQVEKGINLLEAALQNGVEIPHLCYDPRIQPIGSCRLCFVEIEGRPAPVPSCSVFVNDDMVVTTESKAIRDLRKMALELIMAEHCGDCFAPCRRACPADIDIQGFVAHLANGDTDQAAQLIREKMPLPSICGRVCPRFCEQQCRRNLLDAPIDVCGLKRYSGDHILETLTTSGNGAPQLDTGKRVAVVGGGPAGLTAAYFLAQQGHRVTLFDAGPELGGMLRYGIPEYRLPRDLLDKEIAVITAMCEKVEVGRVLGSDLTLDDLQQEFDGVFVGVGCQQPQGMGLDNEDLPGIYTGIGFLRQVAKEEAPKIGDRVMVIGGGNTAMDAARTAIRLGAKEVSVIYRRTREEMPAEDLEVTEALEEGVQFHFLTNPSAFRGQDRIETVSCVKMELGEPDASGRRRPVEIPNSEFNLAVDSVIVAIGQKLDQDLADTLGLCLNRWGTLECCPETLCSTKPGVFAAGDCVSGAATVVEAVGAARKGAAALDAYLRDVVLEAKPQVSLETGGLDKIDLSKYTHRTEQARAKTQHIAPQARIQGFSEYTMGLASEEVDQEAHRCLECGCLDVHRCELRKLAERYDVQSSCFGQQEKRYAVDDSHPFMRYDPDKCILCGKCVAICDQIGVHALGFVRRGYDTVVKPSLDLPLEKVCKSCGQCVSICPTGAFTIKLPWIKPGPWVADRVVETTCLHCSTGCALNLHMSGRKIINIDSPPRHPVGQGSLCELGRFHYDFVYKDTRLTKPLIREEGEWRPVSWEEAIAKAAELLQPCKKQSRAAVFSAPQLTNEESYAMQVLAREGLKTNLLFGTEPGLVPTKDVVPVNYATAAASDLIVTVDLDLAADYPIVAQHLAKTTKKEWTSRQINESPEQFALEIGKGQQTTIIFAEASTSQEDYETIERLASQSIAKGSKTELLILRRGGNRNGQLLMGITPQLAPGLLRQADNWVDLKAILANPKQFIQGAVLAGSDLGPVKSIFGQGVLTIVITTNWIEELRTADVILPAAAFIECDGTVINSEWRVQQLHAASPPPGGKTNVDIVLQLAEALGVQPPALEQKVQQIIATQGLTLP